MTLLRSILPTFCMLLPIAEAQEKVNADSLLIEDFGKRVADYVKLHKAATSQVHGFEAYQLRGGHHPS
jgi:hypothetical protein